MTEAVDHLRQEVSDDERCARAIEKRVHLQRRRRRRLSRATD
jgi:hypothetical protein